MEQADEGKATAAGRSKHTSRTNERDFTPGNFSNTLWRVWGVDEKPEE